MPTKFKSQVPPPIFTVSNDELDPEKDSAEIVDWLETAFGPGSKHEGSVGSFYVLSACRKIRELEESK